MTAALDVVSNTLASLTARIRVQLTASAGWSSLAGRLQRAVGTPESAAGPTTFPAVMRGYLASAAEHPESRQPEHHIRALQEIHRVWATGATITEADSEVALRTCAEFRVRAEA